MALIPELMTVEELSGVTFGHKPPRHGLKLLHWFSAECVRFNEDGEMKLQCDPDNGDYGFHHYGNFEYLLPFFNPYFEVGNLNTLNHPGAQDLPEYVTEAYRGQENSFERNKDRIIISLDRVTRLIGNVYITEHRAGLKDFDPEGTFLLSSNIIREAMNMRLYDFLTRAGFAHNINLGEELWEYSLSSDSSLDSDKTDDEGEGKSCESGEWEGSESGGSTVLVSSSDPKLQDQPSYQEHGSCPQCQNQLLIFMPGPFPESQKQNPGLASRAKLMDEEVGWHSTTEGDVIDEEDTMVLVVIAVVVGIMLVVGFKTLGFIICISLCLETDFNLKSELSKCYLIICYLVVSNLGLEDSHPKQVIELQMKKKRKKMKRWKRKVKLDA